MKALDFLVTPEVSIASGDERTLVYFEITDPASSYAGIKGLSEFKGVVRVPGLIPIPADTNLSFDPPSSDHPRSTFWYLTPATRTSTIRAAQLHRNACGTLMLLTAASLAPGGINDIGNDWAPSHWEHRVGTDIDIDDQARNSLTRIRKIEYIGRQAGFLACEGHPRDQPNHVHCRQKLYH